MQPYKLLKPSFIKITHKMNNVVSTSVLSDNIINSCCIHDNHCVNSVDDNINPTGKQLKDNTNHVGGIHDGLPSTFSQLHVSGDIFIQHKLNTASAILEDRQCNRDDDLEQVGLSETKANTDVKNANQNSHYYRNREKILAYAKIRYLENREKLLAYSKQYQSERKDRVKERNDEYYAKNKERLLRDRSVKIMCHSCGKTITKGSLSSHLKTKYHLKRMEQNNTMNDNKNIQNMQQEVTTL